MVDSRGWAPSSLAAALALGLGWAGGGEPPGRRLSAVCRVVTSAHSLVRL